MLFAVEGELVCQQSVDRRLSVGGLLRCQHQNVEFVETVVIGSVHELLDGRLHLVERRGRGDLERHPIVVVTEVDSGVVFSLAIQVDEVRKIVGRLKDWDERIFEGQVDIRAPLSGRQFDLALQAGDYLTETVFDRQLPHCPSF